MIDDDWEDETTDVVRLEHSKEAAIAKARARTVKEELLRYLAETEREG